ncbi:RNA-binding protein 39, partial [Entomortierella beljakovae]
DKELKEAKAKENQPFDIFALAGVNLPTSSGLGSRNDSQNSVGRRPRAERSGSMNNGTTPTTARRPSQTSTATLVKEDSGIEKKLKRSSMAVKNMAPQDDSKIGSNTIMDNTTVPARGRQLSVSSVASSVSTPSHFQVESPITATPPTPIPSPRTDIATKQDTLENESLKTGYRARDMTHNIHSRRGSADENEEMILDIYGRSVPRSRRQSSDEGSECGNDNRRRRRSDFEDDYRRYESRFQSHSRSRSRSPKRRNSARSRSRSISPYFSQGKDSSYFRKREGYHPHLPPLPTHHETNPYLAASRYLDTAFFPTKIYVGNLPRSVSQTSLRVAFKPFGDIEDMNLVEGKDFGFITYREPESARNALEKMNGTTLDGTIIRVNRAKIPERNRHGFAGVAWMDEDGELARLEEEQHQQAAAIASGLLGSSSASGMPSLPEKPSRAIHQLPPRPRSPILPPKTDRPFSSASQDPRSAIAARGGAFV